MMTKVVKYFVELVRQILIVPVAKSRLTCTFDRYPISSTLLFYSFTLVFLCFSYSKCRIKIPIRPIVQLKKNQFPLELMKSLMFVFYTCQS